MQYLQMKNHERKSRLSISSRDPSLSSLRALISKKLVALTEHHLYKIRYRINEAVEDDVVRPLTSDEDFRHAINQAIHMKSSLRLYIQINPGIFPPLDAMDRVEDGHDSALKDMYSSLIDPADTDSYTMLSFYGFEKIDDSEGYSMMLKKLWSPFKALGRVSTSTFNFHDTFSQYYHRDHNHHCYYYDLKGLHRQWRSECADGSAFECPEVLRSCYALTTYLCWCYPEHRSQCDERGVW